MTAYRASFVEVVALDKQDWKRLANPNQRSNVDTDAVQTPTAEIDDYEAAITSPETEDREPQMDDGPVPPAIHTRPHGNQPFQKEPRL